MKKSMLSTAVFAAVLAAVLAATAQSQTWFEAPPHTPIPPKTAWTVASSELHFGNRVPENVLNTGLGSGKGLDANGVHDHLAADLMWLSLQMGLSMPGNFTYRVDFKEELTLDALKLWNYNETDRLYRGVREVDMYTSLDASPPPDPLDPAWSPLTNHVFKVATGEGYAGDDLLAFPATPARHVLLHIRSSHEYPNWNDCYVGISKIQFYAWHALVFLSAENLTQTNAMLGAVYNWDVPSPVHTAFWAFTDQGTNAANWASAQGCGSAPATPNGGGCTAFATGLLPGSNYVFRFRAEYGGETHWSEPATFTTKTDLPEINLLEVVANSVSDITARVRLVWPGSTPSAEITLYWGAVDGGDNPADWLSRNPGCAPVEAGTFTPGEYSIPFSVNAENTLYRCRAFASNTAGTAASPETLFFNIVTLTASQVKKLYFGGGAKDIPHGTPLPFTSSARSGVWDFSIKNWSIDAAGSAYVAWENGADMEAVFPSGDSGTLVAKMDANIELNILRAPINAPIRLETLDNTPRTLTLLGDKPQFVAASGGNHLEISATVELVAPKGFDKNDRGNFWLRSRSDSVQGTVNVDYYAGTGWGFVIEPSGSLAGVSEFNVEHHTTFAYSAAAAFNTLDPNVVVRLTGTGVLSPRGSNPSSLGQVDLRGGGVLHLNNGTGPTTLAHPVNGIRRGVDGTSALFLDGGTDTPGPLPHTLVLAHDVLPANTLLPWVYAAPARPVEFNPVTRAFEKMSVAGAPPDFINWVPGSRYRLENSITIGSIALQSLGIMNATTLAIGEGETLDITSGHLGIRQNGAVSITGGTLSTSTNRLYILGGWDTSNGITISSALDGGFDLVTSSYGRITLSGSTDNTYTGATHVNGSHRTGPLALQKSAPGVIAIPGPLFINHGGMVQCNGGNQFATNANVTIREKAFFVLADSGSQDFYGVVTLEGGELQGHGENALRFMSTNTFGLVFADGGRVFNRRPDGNVRFQLLTDVLYPATATKQAFIDASTHTSQRVYRLSLSPSDAPLDTSTTRVFEIHKSDALPDGAPELVVDYPLASFDARRPVKLVKAGDGVMELKRPAPSFFGAAVVGNGTLLVNGPYDPQTACGSLNTADVTVGGSGILGGNGGVGGDVFVNVGGTLNPGTPAQPIGTFNIGGDLVFNGGSWHVDLDATSEACDVVHVAGSITLNGNIGPVFHNSAKPRPKGVWKIATFGNNATGKISAPQGCSVRVVGQELHFVSAEAGTLLLVR